MCLHGSLSDFINRYVKDACGQRRCKHLIVYVRKLRCVCTGCMIDDVVTNVVDGCACAYTCVYGWLYSFMHVWKSLMIIRLLCTWACMGDVCDRKIKLRRSVVQSLHSALFLTVPAHPALRSSLDVLSFVVSFRSSLPLFYCLCLQLHLPLFLSSLVICLFFLYISRLYIFIVFFSLSFSLSFSLTHIFSLSSYRSPSSLSIYWSKLSYIYVSLFIAVSPFCFSASAPDEGGLRCQLVV